MDALQLAATLILLHRVDGVEVLINPAQITSLQATRSATGAPNKLVTGEVYCTIGLTDGKFVFVKELCREVERLLEEHRK